MFLNEYGPFSHNLREVHRSWEWVSIHALTAHSHWCLCFAGIHRHNHARNFSFSERTCFPRKVRVASLQLSSSRKAHSSRLLHSTSDESFTHTVPDATHQHYLLLLWHSSDRLLHSRSHLNLLTQKAAQSQFLRHLLHHSDCGRAIWILSIVRTFSRALFPDQIDHETSNSESHHVHLVLHYAQTSWGAWFFLVLRVDHTAEEHAFSVRRSTELPLEMIASRLIHRWFITASFFWQNALTLLLSANRFTSIRFPLRHATVSSLFEVSKQCSRQLWEDHLYWVLIVAHIIAFTVGTLFA